MRRIECGCEFSSAGTLMSQCEAHGAAMKAAMAVAKLEPAKPDPELRQLRRELTIALAPAIAAQSAGLDAETFAEALDRHVTEVVRRFT